MAVYPEVGVDPEGVSSAEDDAEVGVVPAKEAPPRAVSGDEEPPVAVRPEDPTVGPICADVCG